VSNAKSIRSKVLGTKSKPGKLVALEVPGENGPETLEIELRQPNLAMQAQIAHACGVDDQGRVRDIGLLTANVIAQCSFVPGTKERVFTSEDVADLLALDSEILNPIAKVALALMSPSADEVKDLPNGSGATQS
jgi:hypothetical protein